MKIKSGDKESAFRSASSKLNNKLFFSHEISGISSRGMKKLLRGKAIKVWNYIGRSIAYTSSRSYGAFALAFGLLTVFLNLGEYYFALQPAVKFSSILIGCILVLLSVPMLISKRPMCILFQDFFLTDYVFFEFFSITRMPRINNDSSPIPPTVAFFLGFIPAIVGFFLPLHIVILALLLLFFAVISFMSPEFPMILSLLVLPYSYFLPETALAAVSLSVLIFLSYVRKVILGKRVYNFRIYDAIIIFAALLILVGGFLGYGEDSLKGSLVFIAIMLGYFPAANLIVNRRLADCAVNAIIVSSVPVSILAIIEFIVELPSTSFEIPLSSTPGTSAVFSSAAILAAFLLVSALFAMSFALQKKNRAFRNLYVLIFFLEAVALVLTMQPAAWIAAFFGLFAYLIIRFGKLHADVLSFFVILTHLSFLLPVEFLDTVGGFSNSSRAPSEVLASMKETLGVFSDNIAIGVGIGENSYFVASGGGVSEYNLLLSIATQTGVIVLSAFILMMLIRFRHISHFHSYVRNSQVRATANMSFLSIFCLLVFGAGANIFEDVLMIYLFFVTFGIGSATLQRAKSENDDIMDYYGDSESYEYSMLDIGIKR